MPKSEAQTNKKPKHQAKPQSRRQAQSKNHSTSDQTADSNGPRGLREAYFPGDFSQASFERHAAMLGDERMSQPMYARQRAAIVQRLQRDYGNGYVQRLVDHISRKRAEAVQTKLSVGPAGDKYEQEADRVAKQVVSMTHNDGEQTTQRQGLDDEELQMKPLAQRQGLDEEELQMKPLVQRQGLDEEELQMKPLAQRQGLDEEELQMKPLAQRQGLDEEELQMMPQLGPEGGEVDADVEGAIQRAKGKGQPLADSVRAPMEGAFGADFSDVRVHTGPESAAINDSLGARAFTKGQDIHFAPGEYDPGSAEGQRTVAHELTHVVQQGGAGPQSAPQNAVQEDEVIQPARGRSNAVTERPKKQRPTGSSDAVSDPSKITSEVEKLDAEKSPGVLDVIGTSSAATSSDTSLSSQAKEQGREGALSKGDQGKFGSASAGTGVGQGIYGIYASMKKLSDPNASITETMDALLGILEGGSQTVKNVASLASEKEGDDAAVISASAGSVANTFTAIRSGIATIKEIYDAYKAVTTEEGMSSQEKFESSIKVLRGLVDMASATVKTVKGYLDLFQQATGGLGDAIPGLGIALSGVDIAINVYNIIKANVAKKEMQAILDKNNWETGGGVFSSEKKDRRKQIEKYRKQIEKIIAKPKSDAEKKYAEKMLLDLQENETSGELLRVNKDRVFNAAFSIGVDFVKIAGDIANLVPGGQVAGLSLKLIATGAIVAKKAGTLIIQKARDKANPDGSGFLAKHVDLTESTPQKMARRRRAVEYIFASILRLPDGNSEEDIKKFDEQAKQIESFISATGAAPKAVYRAHSKDGIKGAVKLLIESQADTGA